MKYFRRTVSEVKPTQQSNAYHLTESFGKHTGKFPRTARAKGVSRNKKTGAEVRGKYGLRGQRDRGNVRYGLTAEHCGHWPALSRVNNKR